MFSWFKKKELTPISSALSVDLKIDMIDKTSENEKYPKLLYEQLISCEKYYTHSECPNCGHLFDKPMIKKTKCPICKSYLYVRTNYKSKEKMILLQNQIDLLDSAWNKISNKNKIRQIYLNHGISDEEFNTLKKEKNYPDNDIVWSLLNKLSFEYAKNMYWGLYRNTKYNMFEILLMENRLLGAFNMILEVFIYDINGCYNATTNTSFWSILPPFYPKNAQIPPLVSFEISDIQDKLNLTNEEIRKLFFKKAIIIKQNKLIPLSIEEMWLELLKYLNEYNEN